MAKYDPKKIKKYTSSFNEHLKKELKDPKFKQGFDSAYKRWGIAREIIEARKKAKMTQNDLAKSLKTSQSFVARVENGGQNLTIDVLSRLADVLSVKLKKPVKFEIVGKV